MRKHLAAVDFVLGHMLRDVSVMNSEVAVRSDYVKSNRLCAHLLACVGLSGANEEATDTAMLNVLFARIHEMARTMSSEQRERLRAMLKEGVRHMRGQSDFLIAGWDIRRWSLDALNEFEIRILRNSLGKVEPKHLLRQMTSLSQGLWHGPEERERLWTVVVQWCERIRRAKAEASLENEFAIESLGMLLNRMQGLKALYQKECGPDSCLPEMGKAMQAVAELYAALRSRANQILVDSARAMDSALCAECHASHFFGVADRFGRAVLRVAQFERKSFHDVLINLRSKTANCPALAACWSSRFSLIEVACQSKACEKSAHVVLAYFRVLGAAPVPDLLHVRRAAVLARNNEDYIYAMGRQWGARPKIDRLGNVVPHETQISFKSADDLNQFLDTSREIASNLSVIDERLPALHERFIDRLARAQQQVRVPSQGLTVSLAGGMPLDMLRVVADARGGNLSAVLRNSAQVRKFHNELLEMCEGDAIWARRVSGYVNSESENLLEEPWMPRFAGMADLAWEQPIPVVGDLTAMTFEAGEHRVEYHIERISESEILVTVRETHAQISTLGRLTYAGHKPLNSEKTNPAHTYRQANCSFRVSRSGRVEVCSDNAKRGSAISLRQDGEFDETAQAAKWENAFASTTRPAVPSVGSYGGAKASGNSALFWSGVARFASRVDSDYRPAFFVRFQEMFRFFIKYLSERDRSVVATMNAGLSNADLRAVLVDIRTVCERLGFAVDQGSHFAIIRQQWLAQRTATEFAHAVDEISEALEDCVLQLSAAGHSRAKRTKVLKRFDVEVAHVGMVFARRLSELHGSVIDGEIQGAPISVDVLRATLERRVSVQDRYAISQAIVHSPSRAKREDDPTMLDVKVVADAPVDGAVDGSIEFGEFEDHTSQAWRRLCNEIFSQLSLGGVRNRLARQGREDLAIMRSRITQHYEREISEIMQRCLAGLSEEDTSRDDRDAKVLLLAYTRVHEAERRLQQSLEQSGFSEDDLLNDARDQLQAALTMNFSSQQRDQIAQAMMRSRVPVLLAAARERTSGDIVGHRVNAVMRAWSTLATWLGIEDFSPQATISKSNVLNEAGLHALSGLGICVGLGRYGDGRYGGIIAQPLRGPGGVEYLVRTVQATIQTEWLARLSSAADMSRHDEWFVQDVRLNGIHGCSRARLELALEDGARTSLQAFAASHCISQVFSDGIRAIMKSHPQDWPHTSSEAARVLPGSDHWAFFPSGSDNPQLDEWIDVQWSVLTSGDMRIEIVETRLNPTFLDTSVPADAAGADRRITLKPEGSWSQIRYAVTVGRDGKITMGPNDVQIIVDATLRTDDTSPVASVQGQSQAGALVRRRHNVPNTSESVI
ncbi:hypothetical protein [Pandoraea iniqua]|nr:hypothetical protein [Pandoraea iniqua]